MLNEEFYNLKNNAKLFKHSKFNFNNKNKILILAKEIFTLILIFIGRYLYILSLKGCDGDEFSCLHDIKYINDGIDKCIKSSLLFIQCLIYMAFLYFYF